MEKKKDCVFDLDVDCRGLFVDQPEAFFLPRGDEIEEGGGENGPWSDAWDATVRDNTKKERKNNNNNNRRFSNHIRIQLPSHPSLRLFFMIVFLLFFFQGLWFLTRVPDVTVWMACRCLFLHPIISCFLAPCCSLVLLSSTLSQSSALGSTHTHTQKKHVGYFLLQAQCIWKKKGVFESSSRGSEEEEEEGEEEENGPWKMKNLTVFFWGAVEDACSCLSDEYWRSVSAGWKGKSFIRIGLDTHAISGARAFYSTGCGVNEKNTTMGRKKMNMYE